MEPHANNIENTPGNSAEQQPQNPEANAPDRKLEKFPIGALEHLGGDQSQERTGAVSTDPQAAADAATTLPTIPTPIQDDTSTTDTTLAQTPAVAADDDVIEKEWVNKAKKVITQTKGDPYTKEREVSKLQADYMQKRYGKQVKMPDET